MNVLVACEFSGTVRDAFTRRGHYAMSVDLLPTETEGEHYQGDIEEFLDLTQGYAPDGSPWDLVIAHPPCQYLANSGVRWLYRDGERNEERWQAMADAARFFNLFKGMAPMVAIENPIQHKYARAITGEYSQVIQPWQFGHGETKATCLWLEGLPLLEPTHVVDGREARVHRMPPGPDRWKERSRTYPGIAGAMAQQWG